MIEDFSSITGKGIKGRVNDKMYYVGSPNLFDEILPNGIPSNLKVTISELQNQGKTVMVAGTATEILGLLAVADEVRGNSKSCNTETSLIRYSKNNHVNG